MQEAIYIAASGAFKQQQKLSLIANNLTNLGNASFKKDALVFQERQGSFRSFLSLEIPELNIYPERPHGAASYVGIDSAYIDRSQGTLKHTGNELDLALEGEGYFVVKTARGPRYTRNGNNILDAQGFLAMQDGSRFLDDKNKPIQIDAFGGQITIDAKGTLSTRSGQTSIPIGKMKIVTATQPKNLVKEGSGLYSLTGGGEKPAEGATVNQGFLELSNVNSVEEMTTMIATLRAFEAYQKVIQSIDEADDLSVNSIGRLA